MMNDKSLKIEPLHALVILYNLLCGLNFLNTAGIIHRDIKPQNILVKDDCVIRICDFGMARSFSEIDKTTQESALITPRRDKLSQFIQTRWYRAPEVILLQDYDPNIDIWSVGCTFAELLSVSSPSNSCKPLFAGTSCYPISPCA